MIESQVELKHKKITDKILHAFFKIVYAQLGYGFLEKVYENALALPDFCRKAYSNDRKTITWKDDKESV